MNLKEKLEKLKSINDNKTIELLSEYKEEWKNDVGELLNTIALKWFSDYEEGKLMEFRFIPTKKEDPYIGGYLTMVLEISLIGNKYFIIEPVNSVTADSDGKLEFYMMGSIANKVNIVRRIVSKGCKEWEILSSNNYKVSKKLSKQTIESVIEQWLA